MAKRARENRFSILAFLGDIGEIEKEGKGTCDFLFYFIGFCLGREGAPSTSSCQSELQPLLQSRHLLVHARHRSGVAMEIPASVAESVERQRNEGADWALFRRRKASAQSREAVLDLKCRVVEVEDRHDPQRVAENGPSCLPKLRRVRAIMPKVSKVILHPCQAACLHKAAGRVAMPLHKLALPRWREVVRQLEVHLALAGRGGPGVEPHPEESPFFGCGE